MKLQDLKNKIDTYFSNSAPIELIDSFKRDVERSYKEEATYIELTPELESGDITMKSFFNILMFNNKDKSKNLSIYFKQEGFKEFKKEILNNLFKIERHILGTEEGNVELRCLELCFQDGYNDVLNENVEQICRSKDFTAVKIVLENCKPQASDEPVLYKYKTSIDKEVGFYLMTPYNLNVPSILSAKKESYSPNIYYRPKDEDEAEKLLIREVLKYLNKEETIESNSTNISESINVAKKKYLEVLEAIVEDGLINKWDEE